MSRRMISQLHLERRIAVVLACAAIAVLSACGQTTVIKEPLVPVAVNKVGDRISDQAIAADRAYIESLRQRLKKLNDAGRPLDEYSMCKAQAWIDFAFSEYTDNDRGGIVEQSLGEARMLIEKMEVGGAYGYSDTPVLEDSLRLREDLWTFVAETKAKVPAGSDGKAGCVDCALAKLEVQLIWIGNEYKDLGWRHADSAIRAAERYRNEVGTAAANCPVGGVTPAPGPQECPKLSCPVVSSVLPNSAETRPKREPLKIPILVHFAYRKVTIAKESEAILDMIALVLKNNPKTTLDLAGHADTRGTVKQNEWLSRNRAAAVRKYLIAKGIEPRRLTSHGEGAISVPTEAGVSQIDAYARARRVDFTFENLPDIETEKQLLDLQPDH